MEPQNPAQGPSEGGGDDQARRRAAERLIGALQKAVRIVGYFSAEHQAATSALDEIVDIAIQVTNDLTEISVKLTGDGLYVGDHRITHYSPTEDPHLFRLFHNGVRQLSFRAGITREDVVGFLEAITADMTQPEFAEEDVITTLWARNIVGIRWVVVETFTEVDTEEDPEINARASDELSNFLDDSLRERLGEDLRVGGVGGPEQDLALTGGDVRFFQAEQIGTLVASLPEAQSTGTAEAVYSIGSAESDALMGELGRDDTVLPSRFLDAVLAATAGVTGPEDLLSAAHCIALTLGTIARQSGHAAVSDVFGRLLQWMATVPTDDKLAEAVSELVLGGALLTSAVASIDSCADADVPVVLSILGAAPPEAVLRVIRNVTAAKTRDRRRDAFAVLLRRPGGAELFGQLMRELDEDTATDVLDACVALAAAIDAGPVASSASIHASATVRARGVQMLTRCGIDAYLTRVADKIFDPDAMVRMAAIRAMATTGKAAEHFRAALQSPEITGLSLTEKRLLALLLAHMEGMRAAPLFHMLLARKAIFGAVQNDEVRAAAAAGLGYIPDPRAKDALDRVARSSFSTAALRTEARKVAEALGLGKAAYSESELRKLLTPPAPARPVKRPSQPSMSRPPSGVREPAPRPSAPPPAAPRPTPTPGGQRSSSAPPPPQRPTAPPRSASVQASFPTPTPAATPAPASRPSQPITAIPPATPTPTPPREPAAVPHTSFGAVSPLEMAPASDEVVEARPPVIVPTAPPTPIGAIGLSPITAQVRSTPLPPERASRPPAPPSPPPMQTPAPAVAAPARPTPPPPAAGPPGLPTSAMYAPKMGMGVPPKHPDPQTITEQHRREKIDALLAEFNAVDEPFAALAPHSTPDSADSSAFDAPLSALPEQRASATPLPPTPAVPTASATMAIQERPVPDLAPDQAEALAGYMFEDELGQEFRLASLQKPAPAPAEDLQDLLKSYLEEASS